MWNRYEILTPRPLRASSHHWQNLCLVEQSGGKWYYDAKLLLLLVTLQLICWRPIKVAWLHCVTLQASAPAFCLSLFKGQWGRALAALLTQRGCVIVGWNVPFRWNSEFSDTLWILQTKINSTLWFDGKKRTKQQRLDWIQINSWFEVWTNVSKKKKR